MTSNSSFFDLMRENFKQRYWSAALSLLLCFFLYPVTALLKMGSELSEDSIRYLELTLSREAALQAARKELLTEWQKWASADNGAIWFFLLLLATALSFSGFRYLHSRQQTDFYHSLPVSRQRLFLAVNLNSFLIAAVPCLLMSFISAVIIQVNTGDPLCIPRTLGQNCLLLFFYLLFSMTALLAVLLTGNLIVGQLGFGVFLYWGPLFISTLFWMRNTFFRTAWNDPEAVDRIVQYSSPFALCLNMCDTPALQRALLALAAAAVLFFLNLFLYRKRPSEAAEKAMAFPMSEAPIKCILSITMGLVGSMMFHEIQDSLGWSIFGLVCGVVLTHCLMEIIYRFDFRNLFARKGQLAACLLVSLGIFSLFRFDLLGYDRWLPAEDKVESAAMFTDPLETNLGLFTTKISLSGTGKSRWVEQKSTSLAEVLKDMKLCDPALVRTVAVRGIEDLDRDDASFRTGGVTVAWHLKSGRTVYRNYLMDLGTVREELDRTCEDPAFRNAVYPVLSASPEEIAGINCYDISGAFNVPGANALTDPEGKENVAKILAAYQKEFGALTAEARRSEAPVACLQFKDLAFQEAADAMRADHGDDFKNYLGIFNNVGWYPVYPSFRETIEALSSCGVTLNEALSPEHVEALEIRDTSPAPSDISAEDQENETWRKKPLQVTDKEKIREYLSSAIWRELPYSDTMTRGFTAATIDVRQAARKEPYIFQFQGEHVPDEIRSYFGAEQEDVFLQCIDTAY